MSQGRSLRLAFSTLTCPAWDMKRVVEAARAYEYQGVGLRVHAGEIIEPTLPRHAAVLQDWLTTTAAQGG